MTLRGSAGPLHQAYDVALLDLDGVVYLGADAVPGAVVALAGVRRAGLRVGFVTNNASRTPAAVAAHLVRLGVPAAAGDVVTSAQAAARLLADRFPAGAPVLVCGAPALRDAVGAAGLRPVATAADLPVAVVQGYDAELGYPALAEAALAVRAGAYWLATNLDPTLPTPRGELPGNGALVASVATATGRPPDAAAGKPARALHDEAVRRTGAQRPLVVGDRLDTDVAGAVAVGCDVLLVLSGVTDPDALAAAPPERRPTYVGDDLGALLATHPQPQPVEGGVRCGEVLATAAGGRVVVRGAGPRLDVVRAAVTLAWQRADAGDPVTGLGTALAALTTPG